METIRTKCLIIGSGPAGYTAAIYTSRANLSPVMYVGHQPGGQLTTTTEIENFPGYHNGITGSEMMDDLHKQATRFGADVRNGIITEVDFSKRPFTAKADDGIEIVADTVIISTGATARYLGLSDEDKYKGLGVSACATCDGFFYRGKKVAVVGGGDTACEEALYLSNIAAKVYMIVRKDFLRASKVMQRRVFEKATLTEFMGTDKEKTYSLPVDGFFLAIGHTPNTDLFKGQIALDEAGYIITEAHTSLTNVPGVFAAGDVADPRYRQAITAAGSGCKAALDAERYLTELG